MFMECGTRLEKTHATGEIANSTLESRRLHSNSEPWGRWADHETAMLAPVPFDAMKNSLQRCFVQFMSGEGCLNMRLEGVTVECADNIVNIYAAGTNICFFQRAEK